MAEPVDSFAAMGRWPTWLNPPVAWGVMARAGVARPESAEEEEEVAAMPLYLFCRNETVSYPCQSTQVTVAERKEVNPVRTYKYFISTSKHSLPPCCA